MSKGTHDVLSELRALGSQPASTENSDAKDLGPTDIIRAVAVVTVVGASATLTQKLQGSATEGGTYYDIPGGSFLDPSDGAVIDAVGIYEIFIQTDFRWIRVNSVVATLAITHQCLLTAI